MSQSPYHFAYAITRQQLDSDLAQRSTPEAKEQLIREVSTSANHHLATAYPAEERAAGIRQATVDWALQHDEGRNTIGGANLPNLRPDQYEAGYDVRKQFLDRKLESWQAAAATEHSTTEERQAVREMAVAASRSVSENWGDRGRGSERLEDPDYDRGQRKAIMDWSHEHNHLLGNRTTQSCGAGKDERGARVCMSY